MANIAKIDGVYLPRVTAQEMKPEVLMDEARTASGRLRRDVSGVKRQWSLTASYLTPDEKNAILDLLTTKNYGAVLFWLDDFGDESVTVEAYVDIQSVERVEFGPYNNGATIEMTIKEA